MPETLQARARASLTLIFALFAAGYFLSFCFRSVGPLIAPDLMRELDLDAGQLGLLASVYFLTFTLAQPVIGIAMDRHGPARINAALFVIAAAGAIVFAAAQSAAMLAFGRALIGLGVSGALMTPMKALVLWYPPQQRDAWSSTMMAVGGVAAMVASVPAELAMRSIGWRGLFWVLAAASALVAAALWWRLAGRHASESRSQSHYPEIDAADAVPPASSGDSGHSDLTGTSSTSSATHNTSTTQTGTTTIPSSAPAGGYRTIFTSRIFIAYAPLAMFSSGGASAVQSLWAGPWLMQAAGHSRASAAQVLFLYGLALFTGYVITALVSTRLNAIPGAPRRLYIGTLALAYSALAVIISNAWPASAWPWFAYGLTVGTGMLAYPALTRAFPAAIAGRVVTAYNMVMFASAFVLQWAMGALIQVQINGGAATLMAYQASFGALLALQVLALLWFGVMSRRT